MTEDVLEQVIDDLLRRNGYFTMTNVRYGPRAGDDEYNAKLHNQPSDIDVLGVNPTKPGLDRVIAVSCKAMQTGFSPNRWLAAANKGGRYQGRTDAAKHLRELWDPVWSAAHRRRVAELTGAKKFTYVLAVTRLDRNGVADFDALKADSRIGPLLDHLEPQVWTLADKFTELTDDMTERLEPSQVGRLAQMLRAAEQI